MMGLWTNEPLIKRSEVPGRDRCGSCVTKAVKPYQSDFTPLSGTTVGARLASGGGSLWPDQGHGFGIGPVVGDRHDPLGFVDGSMDAEWATSCPRSGASVRPPAPPSRLLVVCTSAGEQGLQLGPSRRSCRRESSPRLGRPAICSDRRFVSSDPPSHLRGWRGGHIPTSTGSPLKSYS